MESIFIALGGNALLRNSDRRTYDSQLRRAEEAFHHLNGIVQDNLAVISHGNGPQVGDILIQNELSRDTTPAMPLFACGSMSQGIIGDLLLTAYEATRPPGRRTKDPAYVITRTLVDSQDEAFQSPTKYIGPFYDRETAENLAAQKGWTVREQEGKGWRRVVPSPEPIRIIERDVIKHLLDTGVLPICTGGGGTPVAEVNGRLAGVEAVIDKDLASSVLAGSLSFQRFMILTDVPNVFINYGKSSQKALEHITLDALKEMYASGQFPAGSMGPKVKAAIRFLESGGEMVNITSLENCGKAIREGSGTVVTRN